MDHLAVMRPRDVVVLDRGYPAHEVLRMLLYAKVDFLIRVPATRTFSAVELLRDTGGNDCRVVIPPADDPRFGAEPLELRAVKVTNPKGEETFFLN